MKRLRARSAGQQAGQLLRLMLWFCRAGRVGILSPCHSISTSLLTLPPAGGLLLVGNKDRSGTTGFLGRGYRSRVDWIMSALFQIHSGAGLNASSSWNEFLRLCRNEAVIRRGPGQAAASRRREQGPAHSVVPRPSMKTHSHFGLHRRWGMHPTGRSDFRLLGRSYTGVRSSLLRISPVSGHSRFRELRRYCP